MSKIKENGKTDLGRLGMFNMLNNLGIFNLLSLNFDEFFKKLLSFLLKKEKLRRTRIRRKKSQREQEKQEQENKKEQEQELKQAQAQKEVRARKAQEQRKIDEELLKRSHNVISKYLQARANYENAQPFFVEKILKTVQSEVAEPQPMPAKPVFLGKNPLNLKQNPRPRPEPAQASPEFKEKYPKVGLHVA